MTGLEIYGTVVATASFVKVCLAFRDRWKRTSRTWESLDQASKAVQLQHDTLHSSTKAFDHNLKKYKRDIEGSLGREDRKEFSKIINDINAIMDKCTITTARLKTIVKKDPINHEELSGLQRELETAVSGLHHLHIAFATHITMESCRRLSVTANSPEASNTASKADFMSVSSMESGACGLGRRDTGISTMSTLSPGSTSRSSIGSADSRNSIPFVKSDRLQKAVENGNFETVQNIVEAGGSETESRKATALFLACRYKKTSMVRYLLSIGASMNIYNDAGLGVLHRTIGTSQSLHSSKAIIDILKLLVECNAPLCTPDKSSLKRTPLHYCAITGNIDAAHYILRQQPNVVNLVDAERKTALYHACEDNSPSPKLIDLLLSKGAHFDKRHRPKISSREKRDRINDLLDKAENKRSLTKQ